MRDDRRRHRLGEEEWAAAAVIILLWEEQGPANERPMQTIYLCACVCVCVPAIIICVWIFFFSVFLPYDTHSTGVKIILWFTPPRDQYYYSYLYDYNLQVDYYILSRSSCFRVFYLPQSTRTIFKSIVMKSRKKKFKSFHRCRHGLLKSAAGGL